MLQSAGPVDSRTSDGTARPGHGRTGTGRDRPNDPDAAIGRWAGTGLLNDHVMPLATAPPDRSMPGRTIPRGRAGARSFPKPPLLREGHPRGSRERPGRRRPLLAAGGALIVLVCGALGAVVANRAPRPTAFLAVAHLVPVGMTVTASDLESVSIAPAAGLDAMPLRDAGQVIGRRAAEDLEPGSLLVPGDLAPQRGLPAGAATRGNEPGGRPDACRSCRRPTRSRGALRDDRAGRSFPGGLRLGCGHAGCSQ